jgi:hypothetical protein
LDIVVLPVVENLAGKIHLLKQSNAFGAWKSPESMALTVHTEPSPLFSSAEDKGADPGGGYDADTVCYQCRQQRESDISRYLSNHNRRKV